MAVSKGHASSLLYEISSWYLTSCAEKPYKLTGYRDGPDALLDIDKAVMDHRSAPNRFPLGYINMLKIEFIEYFLCTQEDEYRVVGCIYSPGQMRSCEQGWSVQEDCIYYKPKNTLNPACYLACNSESGFIRNCQLATWKLIMKMGSEHRHDHEGKKVV